MDPNYVPDNETSDEEDSAAFQSKTRKCKHRQKRIIEKSCQELIYEIVKKQMLMEMRIMRLKGKNAVEEKR